jgi:hypothetical protein
MRTTRAAPLGLLGGQGVNDLGDQGGLVEPGYAAQGGDDAGVEAPGPDGGVAQVDGGVAAGIEGGGGRPSGDGVAGPDLAGDPAQGPFADAPGDAGDGLVVAGAGVQHARGQVPAEGHARETVVGGQDLDTDRVSLPRDHELGGPPGRAGPAAAAAAAAAAARTE